MAMFLDRLTGYPPFVGVGSPESKIFPNLTPTSLKLYQCNITGVALSLRMYQRCCATYESASLRMFKLGRTDTIRSCSIDSANFVKAMDDPAKQKIEKVTLLEKAVKAHRAYTDMVSECCLIERIDTLTTGLGSIPFRFRSDKQRNSRTTNKAQTKFIHPLGHTAA